ncbi:acetyltransferase, GNAT family protein [Fimicolochytrium jonesii]|uniref:acetyltransferase, GNAT family protein n=1 Tax=Fimicolochytrium jonesii TaxID=1396493 RepID=UPI0022FEE2C1|nr:acetyltransferase, GNAT family protein [Fimicolochytrium jonesii]KAI8816988.1 acetyltransferase, GNAT family protein [Fimicolochytrium jonesii]
MTGELKASKADIRPATLDDVDAIVATLNEAYRGDGGWTTEAHLVQGDRAEPSEIIPLITSRPPTAGTLLVYHPSSSPQPLACVDVEIRPNSRGYFGLFAVRHALQGKGVGNLLMEAAFDKMREQGCTVAEITVIHVRKDIIAWYQRKGFVLTDRMENFPANAGRSKLLPGVDGRFVYLERQL